KPGHNPLAQTPATGMKLIARCDAVLLPGSKADVDPVKYDAERHPETAPPDPKRDTADDLLLQDACNMRKPVLGICYGLQSLNVYRMGTLVQHIDTSVNHASGRKVPVAHKVQIDRESKLASVVNSPQSPLVISVNSSHHQAAEAIGDGLRVVAKCPEDGVVEALEGTSPDHFVLAVQWDPERSPEDETSRALFRALVEAARARRAQLPRADGPVYLNK